jgi:hypothetical protein
MNARDDAPLAGFEDFDAMDPALRRRYQEVLEARLGPAWPVGRKARHLVLGAAGLAGFLAAGSLSLTEPTSTPAPTRALLGMFALLSLGWSVFAMRGLARLAGDYASERLLAARIAVGFALAALVGLGLASAALQKGPAALPMLLAALGFVVVAAAGSIHARIDQAELSRREQLLRLEARLANFQGRPPAA